MARGPGMKGAARAVVPAFVSALLIVAAVPFAPYQLTEEDRALLSECEGFERFLERRLAFYIDPEAEEYLNRIIERLSGGLEVPAFVRLRARLLRDPEVNAHAYADGMILVNIGIVARMRDENHLAAVLAHEISHIALYHAILHERERQRSTRLANLTSVVTGMPAETNLLHYAAMSSYNRKEEEEADIMAVRLMSRAGYDPAVVSDALKEIAVNLGEYRQVQPPIYVRTHPRPEERIGYVQRELEASKGRPVSYTGLEEREYISLTMELRRRACLENIDVYDFGTARYIAFHSLRIAPDDPGNLVTMGMVLMEWADNKRWMDHRYVKEPLEENPQRKECTRDILADPRNSPSFKNAEYYFNKALEIDPDCAEAHKQMGRLHYGRRDYEKALEEFRRYLQLAPGAHDYSAMRKRVEFLEERTAGSPKKQSPNEAGKEEEGE